MAVTVYSFRHFLNLLLTPATSAGEQMIAVPDFNPFDMDFDGDIGGIDFLALDDLMRQGVQPDHSEREYARREAEEHSSWGEPPMPPVNPPWDEANG